EGDGDGAGVPRGSGFDQRRGAGASEKARGRPAGANDPQGMAGGGRLALVDQLPPASERPPRRGGPPGARASRAPPSTPRATSRLPHWRLGGGRGVDPQHPSAAADPKLIRVCQELMRHSRERGNPGTPGRERLSWTPAFVTHIRTFWGRPLRLDLA